MTPMSNRGENTFLVTDSYHPVRKRDGLTWVNHISEGYFSTIGTRLLRGRDIEASDRAGSSQVAIITQSVARKVFGGADPLGQQFRRPMGKQDSAPYEVIGVVEDTKFGSLRDSTGPVIYLPAAQADQPAQFFTVEIRSDIPPTTLIAGVKSVMAQLSPPASLQFTTLSEQVARSLSRDRLLATLATFFGGLALLLALIGLYGTMAYSVARRRNEIGIRIALGAARQRVVRMVVGEVIVVVITGLCVGVALAVVATRLVASFLFGLRASDPATWIASAAVLIGVALLAGAAPAWRAARMNPMMALREE